MEFYLHVPIKKGLFRSPLRVDRRPTCSLFRNKSGKLIFKDFATGQYLSCINVVMTIYNCGYYDALKIIANDFGIIEYNNITKNEGKINTNPVKIEDKEISKVQVEIKDFSDQELKWWNKFGVTPEILKKFKVYSCKHVFLNDRLIAKSQMKCPIYGYYGGKIQKDKQKIELWKCYFPKRQEYRFIGNFPAKKIQGFELLPKRGKLCIITKSMKDCLSMYSLGITAIAPNSEYLFVSDSVLDDLKKRFKYIVVMYDNDTTGISNLRKIKKEHPELNYFIIPRKYEAKDFSDFYAKYGKDETVKVTKEYIKTLHKLGNKNEVEKIES